jgi:hypothetical protein
MYQRKKPNIPVINAFSNRAPWYTEATQPSKPIAVDASKSFLFAPLLISRVKIINGKRIGKIITKE